MVKRRFMSPDCTGHSEVVGVLREGGCVNMEDGSYGGVQCHVGGPSISVVESCRYGVRMNDTCMEKVHLACTPDGKNVTIKEYDMEGCEGHVRFWGSAAAFPGKLSPG